MDGSSLKKPFRDWHRTIFQTNRHVHRAHEIALNAVLLTVVADLGQRIDAGNSYFVLVPLSLKFKNVKGGFLNVSRVQIKTCPS